MIAIHQSFLRNHNILMQLNFQTLSLKY
jgi:hypothetical protein